MHPALKLTALAAALCLAATTWSDTPAKPAAGLISPDPQLSAAVQKALSNNPEVTAQLNALRAAVNEVDVARGGLYPRVDLNASAGRDSDRIVGRVPNESDHLYRNGVALTLNQLLWDGRSTYREVERLGHARLVRWFEFQSATEQTALEASGAYYDVLRYKRLVDLAEDNYVQHKYVFDQLQSRVKAGVGRGVDFEQANARLSLAESNLTTEIANLHDVTARYERIVGERPTATKAGAPLSTNIVASGDETVRNALSRNASISAAVENLRAARAQVESKQGSAYQPKVEARVRSGAGKNFDGVEGQKRDTAAEVLLSWNLYSGGSDRARVRQLSDLLNQAADLRDKACRDVRQTTTIAHNDLRKLTTQLEQLDRNVLAIQKTRDAYRQQFEIGQRNLLDLLNSENELYTAKRSYANAEYDLDIAYARTHAASNTLVQSLGLSRPDDGGSQSAAQGWDAGEDSAQRCPATSVEAVSFDKAALDARAAAMQSIPRTSATPASNLPAPRTLPPATTVDLTATVRDWAAAWSAQDFDRYAGFYSKDFAANKPKAQWLAERKRLVGKPGPIEVKAQNVQTQLVSPAIATTRFEQIYTSSTYKDHSAKVLTWRQEGDGWRIIKESNR